jgi:outer membrane protein OmpA-like peptidoglycan-associated protein/opacity protein-like surface antigen
MRGSHLVQVALVLGWIGVATAHAQVQAAAKVSEVPRFDVAVGYDFSRANAPPSNCNCFSLEGGFVTAGMHINNWLSVDGQFSGTHASDISVLGQDLTLTTYTFGPRFSYRKHRLTPYGQVLVGAAHGSDSYFPSATSSSTSATSFAVSAGGGLDIDLTSRFAIRAIDAQYLKTSFPNGTDNSQNHLMIGAGIVIKFNGHTPKAIKPAPPVPVAPPPPPPPPTVAFTCGTNVANVPLGQMVEIFGEVKTQPENLDVKYSWSSDGGTIDGSGATVSINTTGMAIADYKVTGHAALASDPSIGTDCTAVFRVVPVEVPPAATTTYVIADTTAKNDKLFHENVKDAYFDYNSAAIRPETRASIKQAAIFLIAHPTMHALISGWTDPRGSTEYNLALGIRRANAVRAALIAAGVPGSQLEVISNGKSSQVCTTMDKECLQKNRRVSFSMKQ